MHVHVCMWLTVPRVSAPRKEEGVMNRLETTAETLRKEEQESLNLRQKLDDANVSFLLYIVQMD